MNEKTIAGPAPGRSGSPAMAVPVVAKIPAPIVAPTPRAVRCHLLRERLSPVCSASGISSAIGLRVKSCCIGLGSVIEQGHFGRGHPGHREPQGVLRGTKAVRLHHVLELPAE